MGILSGGKSTSTSTYTPVQSQEIGNLLSGAQSQFDKGFFDPSVYQNSGVQGFNQQQLQSLQQQTENAQGFQSFTPQAQAGISQMLSGEVNPIYQQQAQGQADFLQRNFERNVLPSIGQGFQGAGQFGGSRQGIAEGIAASDLNQQVANSTAGFYAQGAQQAQQAQQFGLSNLGSLLGQAQSPASQQFNIGSQFQGMDQAQLTDKFQRDLAMQQLPYQELQAFKGLIGGDYGGTTTSTTPTAGLGGSLLGAAGTIGGMALGGPLGAMAGGSIGGSVGGQVFGQGNEMGLGTTGAQSTFGL